MTFTRWEHDSNAESLEEFFEELRQRIMEAQMRIKQFDDKMGEDPDFMWFANSLFPKTLATEGKRVDATARLYKLCRKAYSLAGTELRVDPPLKTAREQLEEAVELGQESVSISSESARDPS